MRCFPDKSFPELNIYSHLSMDHYQYVILKTKNVLDLYMYISLTN